MNLSPSIVTMLGFRSRFRGTFVCTLQFCTRKTSQNSSEKKFSYVLSLNKVLSVQALQLDARRNKRTTLYVEVGRDFDRDQHRNIEIKKE